MDVRRADIQLVNRLLAGDETAFGRFFGDHYGRLYRYALPRVDQDRDAANDIAHQTLSTAVGTLRSFSGREDLFSWLKAICRDVLSKGWCQSGPIEVQKTFIEGRSNGTQTVAELAPLQDQTLPLSIQQREHQRVIHLVLDLIPPSYGDILEKTYLESKSPQTIARELGMKIFDVEPLLGRARREFAIVYATIVKSDA